VRLVQRNLDNQRLIPGVNLSLKLSGVGATGP